MSVGGVPVGGRPLFRAGLWDERPAPLDTTVIVEDLSHSWMQGAALHRPLTAGTRPAAPALRGPVPPPSSPPQPSQPEASTCSISPTSPI
jgi:hypothetical protein